MIIVVNCPLHTLNAYKTVHFFSLTFVVSTMHFFSQAQSHNINIFAVVSNQIKDHLFAYANAHYPRHPVAPTLS